MSTGATKREILEKKLEKRLQYPKTEPLISLPLYLLEDITCGFSTERELGRGACGVVYKGVLQSGKAIAVKKIFDTHLLGNDNQVENEIICLTEVRHQNVVQLVGYCVETKSEVVEHSGKHVMAEKRVCLLCFEFLCNGSLDKHLSDDSSGLDWDERYKIIRGVCRGLHYLHDERRIAHRDLKPQNILMDDTMMPKIADFGLSRLLSEEKSRTLTRKLQGTPGYMAPECIEQRSISFEADIFSIGVIIIEIITGHRDYPDTSERTETSLKHYTDKVVRSWRNRLVEITPMHMSPEMCIQQVQQCISTALKCLEHKSNKRPTSLDIVQTLNAVEPKCTSPGNPPSVIEKDRRNQNLQVNVNIINIPNTISAINGLNECSNLFQWVTSAISSPKHQLNETQKEKLHGYVRQLQGDLQCLSDTLPAMYNLIDRAEWRIHEHYVAELLSRLKDAVYDAEDILDEFRWYETMLVEGNAISVEPVIDFFHSVTQGSFNKVVDIHKRLNFLSGQLEKMGLLQALPRFDKSFRPETTAFLIEPDIFGRNEEKEKLIGMLGVPTDSSTEQSGRKSKRNGATMTNVQVLPIVGIGGIGKTTLAQDICNNSKVIRHFELIIWICVSDDFDVKRLTKEALEQSSREVPKNDNLNFLQGALSNSLKTNRFLLVLDDMWDENELDWKRFCAPFRNVLQGSMMLVTTRSPKVADVVRTMDPFPLGCLNEHVFRKFFKFCVFGSNNSNIDPELEWIGDQILPKLRGSPLAAKTLGRLLGMSFDPAHWHRILKSQLWELQQKETDILPALRLSYMYLPFYLKRCFSFCAVYPTDYLFKKDDLVEIWVAEGFVEHQPNVSLQHSGGQYFEELAHLSFFQKHPWDNDKYVMHDLIHEMAQLVAKDECCIIKDKKDFRRIPQNVLHLLVLNGGDIECSDLLNLCKHRKLRTLLCDMSLYKETGITMMEVCCAELSCMRVMVCSSISKWGLPRSICNLKHLRYLKVLGPSGHSVGLLKGSTDQGQRSQFKLKNYNGESLPSWYHLQNSKQIHTYDRNDNTSLSLSDVKITDCRNLLNLEQFLQPAFMPTVKKIEISKCRHLESVPTERFGDFHFLEVLSVSHSPMIKSQHLFSSSLKKLYLEDSGNLGYKIECSSLTILNLCNCPLESIELQMWNLPLLLELEISCCSSLTIIRYLEPISSESSLGGARSRMGKFLKLIRLTFIMCDRLETIDDLLHLPAIENIIIFRCGMLSLPANRLGSFTLLKGLMVSNCPRVDWQSGMLLPLSLQELTLSDCGDFSACFPSCLENLTSLESLEIVDCECIVSVPGQLWSSNLKSVQRLKFHYCPKLKSVGGPNAIAHIRDLYIAECPELKEFKQTWKRGSFF